MEDCAQESIDKQDLQVVGSLGKGCQAEVYLVRHAETGQYFAVKVVSTECLSPKENERVEFQVRSNFLLTQKIQSKRFPFMYGFWRGKGSMNILFELCQENAESGFKKLSTYTQRYNYLIVLLFDVLIALQELQALNIIHRDIKPENILLRQGTFKLADLGLSRLKDSPNNSLTNNIGNRLGWSPEFVNANYTYKTDIWSLGVNAFYMLENTLPFDQQSLQQIRNNPNAIEQVISSPNLRIDLQASGRRSKNILSFLHILLSQMIVIDAQLRSSSSELLSSFFSLREGENVVKNLMVSYLRERQAWGEFYLMLILGFVEFYRMEGKIKEGQHSNKRLICLKVKNTVLKVVRRMGTAFRSILLTNQQLLNTIQCLVGKWEQELQNEIQQDDLEDIQDALSIYRISKVREKFPLFEWMVKLYKTIALKNSGLSVPAIHLWHLPLELYKLI